MRRSRVQTEPLDEAQQYSSLTSDGEMPYRATERRELAVIVDDAIQRLRPEYAELITLKYEQDLTVEEIAEVTGLPIGTVKSSLHRARKDLADSLRRRGLSTIR